MDRTADTIPHLGITIHEETLRVDVKQVIDLLRPGWITEQLVFENKSDGYINKNYHCHMGDDKDGLLVRLVSTKLGEDFLDRSVRFMTYLRRRGMGAKLLCTFTNGLVMEHLQGEPITWQGFRRIKEERNWLGVARELARYHGTTNLEDIRELNIMTYKEHFQEFREKLKSILESDIIPKESLVGLPSVDELQDIRSKIYKKLRNTNAELCFCHGDPNPTNFVITDQGPILVDYDFCCLEFAACNIALFFIDVMDVTDMKSEEETTEAEKDIFIREYLKQRRLIDPTRGPVTEKQVRYWKYLVRLGELFNMVYSTGIFMYSQVLDKKLDLKNSHIFWQRYQRNKHVLDETFLDDE